MNLTSDAVALALKRLPGLACRRLEPMKNHTSFKIGGRVAAMFFPKTTAELTALVTLLKDCGAETLVIGNGTNLLVDDGDMDLVVIKTTGLAAIEQMGETVITAACGVLLSSLAVFAEARGLSGLEFAHGIPGTLGGAVSMNAGAYGGEMKDVVTETTALSPDGAVITVSGSAQDFSYRRSRFSDTGDVILSSTLALQRGDAGEIRVCMEELARKRRQSQPLTSPSAGSTFKRPQTGYAAALIDEAGLKGYAVGGAMVSEKHAGFVVNRGGATFEDVLAVMSHVQETVQKRFGIALEPEVKIIRRPGR
ncbi:UDP-N-acetylmuramate dehydrogenase [Oscillospiraceae bacterium CM]|nr:UDP-N-acetylmuramate dehydrogenase [Oscillospiraceae bacterium CM]